MKTKIEKMFGKNVLDDNKLKKYMGDFAFDKYKNIKEVGGALDKKTASCVAKAIKKWAIKMGAAHYSHWFMPLNNKTAEKQVSFIEINSNGKLIEDFSYKALIKGETDASSFPNGGERMTFEARGYTVWDYTSPCFIKEDSSKNKVVYIPTAFCSYNGMALDEKTPLLRAVESLNTQSLRVLKHLGYTKVKKVNMLVGAEQEYFLIDTKAYEKRLDLKMLNRTLYGTKPLKSQEMCSHYFGMIENNVSEFMNEVDKILWGMGITAKLQHNEVAPCQHEFVPIFNAVNIANDQNQLIMEVISSTAKKYGFTALFTEKPFDYINGSGKHLNWSLSTDNGMNLFDVNLKDRTLFNTFFIAMISAIDEYYKLVRLSTAYRDNDLRLGGNEAPPTIISVFTGDYLLKELENLEINTEKMVLDTGVKTLPKMEKDFCDRNRTSPFAFSGNKFEFRMVGSSQSVAWPTTCVCTILAKTLKDFADYLDNVKNNKNEKIVEMLKNNFVKHKRIIFNGNSYDESWEKKAKELGLENFKNSMELYRLFDSKEIISVFEQTKVLDKNELALRKTTLVENYKQTVILEAKTMSEMFVKQISPKLNMYIEKLENRTKSTQITQILEKVYKIENQMQSINIMLKNELDGDLKNDTETLMCLMTRIRKYYDILEEIMYDECKPFPTYNDILFN